MQTQINTHTHIYTHTQITEFMINLVDILYLQPALTSMSRDILKTIADFCNECVLHVYVEDDRAGSSWCCLLDCVFTAPFQWCARFTSSSCASVYKRYVWKGASTTVLNNVVNKVISRRELANVQIEMYDGYCCNGCCMGKRLCEHDDANTVSSNLIIRISEAEDEDDEDDE
jgi:hypothetical protein